MNRLSLSRTRRLFNPILSLAAGVAACSSLLAQQAATTASAEESGNDDEIVELEAFVVSGLTESMVKAQQLKRESLQIVDSIVADDINKLPDLSVTEALQRVSGISITRDLGEGANVALRGLTDVTSTLNGQEVFSPQVVSGESRVMNLQTIPAELISGINVIKTPTADMIEGGIAGTIDIRLRKPLDFDGGLNGYVNARLEHGEAAETSKLQYSGMLTDTWEAGNGKVGALVSYTKQDRDIRQDISSTGYPLIYDTEDGPVVGVNGSYEPRYFAKRKREGTSGVLQWAPTDEIRAFVEYSHSTQTTLQDSVAPWFTPPNAGRAITDSETGEIISYVVSDVELYPGLTALADHDRNAATPMVQVPVARSMTVLGGAMNCYSIVRDWTETTDQYTGGFSWNGDRLTIDAEISHMKSKSDFDNLGLYSTLPNVDYVHDVSYSPPSVLPVDPNDITVDRADEGTIGWWFYHWIQNHADSTSGTIDVDYRLGSDSFFRNLKFGARFSERSGRVDRVTLGGGAPGHISDYPTLYRASLYGDFLDGNPGKVNNYLEINPEPLRNKENLAAMIGLPATLPAPQPNYAFDITEKTWAVYGMTTFAKREKVHFDGNVGVRVIGTEVTARGFELLNSVYSPVVEDGAYTDVLPSLNTRFFLQDDLFLRLSLSKQLSRHPFGRLNPNLRLTPPSAEGQRGTGQAGNADLPPLRTDQIDVSIEKYFNDSTSIYLAYYHKKIDGYTQNATSTETIDGVEYDITRPYAVNDAKVQGVEFGYQQFFTFLPGPLSGLGALANYTWVDAKDPGGVPLTNLSKNSYNLILMYEKYGWTGRLAYNWRDKFAINNSLNGGAIGTVPDYQKAYGWLDASLSYQFNKNFSLSFEVTNALRTQRESYYRDEIFQHEDALEDRQYYLSATWKL